MGERSTAPRCTEPRDAVRVISSPRQERSADQASGVVRRRPGGQRLLALSRWSETRPDLLVSVHHELPHSGATRCVVETGDALAVLRVLPQPWVRNCSP